MSLPPVIALALAPFAPPPAKPPSPAMGFAMALGETLTAIEKGTVTGPLAEARLIALGFNTKQVTDIAAARAKRGKTP